MDFFLEREANIIFPNIIWRENQKTQRELNCSLNQITENHSGALRTEENGSMPNLGHIMKINIALEPLGSRRQKEADCDLSES